MVALDDAGEVVRPALLWNDTRSAPAAAELTAELGGAGGVGATRRPRPGGLVHGHQAALARRPRARSPLPAPPPSAFPTTGSRGGWPARPAEIVTDRSDASGTGYWSAAAERVPSRPAVRALGHPARTPRVAQPDEVVGTGAGADWLLGPGCGDNAGAALGLGASPGDVVVSLGTSGVVTAVSLVPAADATGAVAGFADASGHFLPLVATLNAAQVLDVTARLLGVDHAGLSRPGAVRAAGRRRGRARAVPPG